VGNDHSEDLGIILHLFIPTIFNNAIIVGGVNEHQ
jgi:hypothetical protein